MKKSPVCRVVIVLTLLTLSISPAYSVDLLLGTSKIVGDPSTGVQVDSNADGTTDVIMRSDGSIESKNSDGRIIGQYKEYVDFNDEGDGNICLGGQRGAVDVDLCFGFGGTETTLFSTTDNILSIKENLRIQNSKSEPAYLTIQSVGSKPAKALFNEDAYTRGEIFSDGASNSFRINSTNVAGLYLNGENKFNVMIASGGGKAAIGHKDPKTTLDVNGAMTLRKITAEPAAPPNGSFVVWMSNGSGEGDDGDIMIKATSNNVTKTTTLVKF